MAQSLKQHAAAELQRRIERVLLAGNSQTSQFGLAFVGLKRDFDAIQDIVQAIRL